MSMMMSMMMTTARFAPYYNAMEIWIHNFIEILISLAATAYN